MKKLLKAILLLFFVNSAAAQEFDIKDWQSKNPTVVFIEASKYSDMDSLLQKKIDNNVIVYHIEPTEHDVTNFENKRVIFNSQFSKRSFNKNDINADEIKIWISLNEDVHIYSNERYDNLDDSKKELIPHDKLLIYHGNYLTLNDIEDYENQ